MLLKVYYFPTTSGAGLQAMLFKTTPNVHTQPPTLLIKHTIFPLFRADSPRQAAHSAFVYVFLILPFWTLFFLFSIFLHRVVEFSSTWRKKLISNHEPEKFSLYSSRPFFFYCSKTIVSLRRLSIVHCCDERADSRAEKLSHEKNIANNRKRKKKFN